METEDEGWVTDPRAIEAIALLKEFKPGDKIIFQRGRTFGLDPVVQGAVGTVTTNTNHSHWAKHADTVCFVEFKEPFAGNSSFAWAITKEHIAAWKPKTKVG